MAVKSNFASGDVLTASNVNTYLTNGGLVYITEVNLTGTAVNMTSCFSSTFDSYRLVVSNLKNGSTAVFLGAQLLTGTTPANAANSYKSQRLNANGATVTGSSASDTYAYVSPFGTVMNGFSCDIYNPALAQYTLFNAQGNYDQNTGIPLVELNVSSHQVATAYDGLRLIAPTGSFSSGKAILYGYRQS